MNVSALSTGINGINQGLGNMRRNASDIAQAINNSTVERPVEVTSALINLKLDTLQIQASAKVVETVHEIIGSLLDVTA